jgi:hypothetical protein
MEDLIKGLIRFQLLFTLGVNLILKINLGGRPLPVINHINSLLKRTYQIALQEIQGMN